MITLSQARMKRMTAVHGWSGVLLGLLLYVVVATGTIAVFSEQIGRWSAGGAREFPPLTGAIDDHVRKAAETVDPAFREDIAIWDGLGPDFNLFFHTHRLNPATNQQEDFGTFLRLDQATGAELERHDGFVWTEPRIWEKSALRNFLVDLHVQLYLPNPWGMILTGVLGLMMMAAVVSGILIHRHLLRDLFLAERPGGRLAGVRDRHALSATWSLPFAFLLAFTGSFLSFASTVGVPLVATVAFGGDQEAMLNTLFEPAAAEDPTPRPLADLDRIRADAVTRSGGAEATFIDVSHYGRADSRVTVWHDPSQGALTYTQNLYEGTTGAFLGQRAPVGHAPSVGGTLYGVMGPLHYGNFAGSLSQVIWGALGVAMCFVILSGFRIWVRRRADQALWRGFAIAVQVTGYGLPLAVCGAAVAFFVSHGVADTFWWTPVGFVAGAGVAILLGVLRPDEDQLGRIFQRLLAGLCLFLPILRLATGGMDWTQGLIWRQYDVITFDILFCLAGVGLWAFSGSRLGQRGLASERPAE